jgi:hypothetical protein
LASACQEAAGYYPAPIEKARYQQILAAIRAHLDDEVAGLAWEQGRAMSTQEPPADTLFSPWSGEPA